MPCVYVFIDGESGEKKATTAIPRSQRWKVEGRKWTYKYKKGKWKCGMKRTEAVADGLCVFFHSAVYVVVSYCFPIGHSWCLPVTLAPAGNFCFPSAFRTWSLQSTVKTEELQWQSRRVFFQLILLGLQTSSVRGRRSNLEWLDFLIEPVFERMLDFLYD